MADIKRDQDALFSTIYKIATDLVHAGHVSEWDFKSYVLVTMFYRYISENLTAYINEGERAAGDTGFDGRRDRQGRFGVAGGADCPAESHRGGDERRAGGRGTVLSGRHGHDRAAREGRH